MTDIVEQLGPDEVLQEARELLRFYQASDPSKPYTCSVIADCISMIEALRAESEWRDISTAPRDGLIDIWLTTGQRWCDCYYDSICDEWRTSRPGGRLVTISARHVSHWRPVPAPPQRNEVTK